jgi:hypothetical protein
MAFDAARTSSPYTYPDPTLSLWQSAAAVTAWAKGTGEEALQTESVFMTPVHAVAAEALGTAPPEARPESVAVLGDCAAVSARFLWAEIKGDKQLASIYAGELKKAVCDAAGWSTCLTNYLKFKAEGGQFPYLEDKNQVVQLEKDPVRLAILGDWGTGEGPAVNLLNEVKSQNPDVLVHLGDIYYSGTQQEMKRNFLDICHASLGSSFPLYTLCGNHDMYSGGNGYYWLLGQIKQEASYFALRNKNWQLLAMDTGHNDRNPMTVGSNMTSLNPKEVEWLLDKINSSNGCKTILLSHHQLFSAFGSVGHVDGKAYAFNPELHSNFRNVIGRVAWWFWGHEHTLAAYKPYMGLQRGRCVGCSAVPVFTGQQSYTPDDSLVTLEPGNKPTWEVAMQLGNNGTDYHHAFAILTLSGVAASVEYFQVPLGGRASRLWSEDYSK